MSAIASHAIDDFAVVAAPQTVRLERLLPGPVERVWAYLVEPDKRRRWFADGPMDLRVGGAVSLVWRNGQLSKGDIPAPDGFGGRDGVSRGEGSVTAYDPPHRIAFTWAHEGGPETEATFELTPRGDRVLLVVTHRRLATDGLVLGVSAGWHAHLAILQSVLEETDPPPFWATFTEMRATYRRRYDL